MLLRHHSAAKSAETALLTAEEIRYVLRIGAVILVPLLCFMPPLLVLWALLMGTTAYFGAGKNWRSAKGSRRFLNALSLVLVFLLGVFALAVLLPLLARSFLLRTLWRSFGWLAMLPLGLVGLLLLAWSLRRLWPVLRRGVSSYLLWFNVLMCLLGTWLVAVFALPRGVVDAVIAFLLVWVMAKMLELRTARDTYIVFMLYFVVMMCVFMFSQDLWTGLYLLLALLLNLRMQMKLSLRECHNLEALPMRVAWRDACLLLLFAVPLSLLVFFFFPRLSPIWGMPLTETKAMTGLPDEMSPGAMGKLATSAEIAFRVKFNGNIPPVHQLYWRGPVLWHYNGQTWFQRHQDYYEVQEHPRRNDPASRVDYRWIRVKSDLNWVLPLDYPTKGAQRHVLWGSEGQMRMRQMQEKIHYIDLTSYLNSQQLELSAQDLSDALRLPELSKNPRHPRTHALAERLWRESGGDAETYINNWFAYIRNNAYVYTLDAAPEANETDRFMFEYRAGFCEHYASSFAYMARVVGIPTRVVIGYQGGELNTLNRDWLVREESAHAWVESWLPGEGWRRIDPTLAVSPSRVEQGQLGSDAEGVVEGRAFSRRVLDRFPVLRKFNHAMLAVNAFWQDWIIDLDHDKQAQIANRFGVGAHWMVWAIALLIFLGLVAAVLLLWLVARRHKNKHDAVTRAMYSVMQTWQRRGLGLEAGEAPAQWLRRVAARFSAQQSTFLYELAQDYESLRYRRNAVNEEELLHGLREIKHWNLGKTC